MEEPPVEESTGEVTSGEETTSCRVVTASVAPGNYAALGPKTVGRKLISTPIPAPNQVPTPVAVPTPNAPATIPNAQPTAAVVPGAQNSQAIGIPLAEPTISVVPETLDSVGNYVPPVTLLITPAPSASPPPTTIPATLNTESGSLRLSSPTKAGNTIIISGSTIVLLPTDAPVSDNTEDVVVYFSKRDYIIGAFLPTVIAVLFSIPWGIIDTAAKEMEPFVRLASTDGSSARDSLCLDYPGDLLIVSPFKSLSRGHWIIFLTSMLSLGALIVAPLSSETVFISLQGTCNADTAGERCIQTLSVYPPAARVLQGLLALMAVTLLLVIIFARQRSTGVYANPHSLAAVATLFHHTRLLDMIQNIPSSTREKALISFLNAHSYEMGYYQHNQGTAYGIIVDSKDQGESTGYTYINLNDGLPSTTSSAGNQARKMKRAAQVLFFSLALVVLAAVILWYRFSASENVVFDFMNSQSFGVRFLFTAFGVLIRLFWDYARSGMFFRGRIETMR